MLHECPQHTEKTMTLEFPCRYGAEASPTKGCHGSCFPQLPAGIAYTLCQGEGRQLHKVWVTGLLRAHCICEDA
eukprot:scaffold323206_cov22-Tisochrysis_lutea.AAC.1